MAKNNNSLEAKRCTIIKEPLSLEIATAILKKQREFVTQNQREDEESALKKARVGSKRFLIHKGLIEK